MKLLIIFSLALCILADTCGGNCPIGNFPECFCGTSPSPQNIPFWCYKYIWNQTCCICIAGHESGGNANAIEYHNDGTYNIGLWQINSTFWGRCNGGTAPCFPSNNLNCAIDVYQKGGNTFKLWPTAARCGCA